MTSILKGSNAIKNVSLERHKKILIKFETLYCLWPSLRSILSRFWGFFRGENQGWNWALFGIHYGRLDLVSSKINDDDYGFFHITTNWAFQGSIPSPATNESSWDRFAKNRLLMIHNSWKPHQNVPFWKLQSCERSELFSIEKLNKCVLKEIRIFNHFILKKIGDLWKIGKMLS